LNRATQDVDPDDGLGHEESFGDDMWDKLVDMLRLGYINIGGFGISRNAQRDAALRAALNRYEFDAVGLSELNVLWHRVDESERIPERTFGWWQPFRQTTTYFRAWNSTSPHQFGGVSLWSMGHLATRWMQDDSDRRGLGRWTSTLYRGVGDVRLRYVAAYCPNPSVTGAETVWSQHKSFFMSKFMGIDPIDAFYDDLCKDLKGWVASGEQVVLMLDLNDDIRTSRFTKEMESWDLYNCWGSAMVTTTCHAVLSGVVGPWTVFTFLLCSRTVHVATYPLTSLTTDLCGSISLLNWLLDRFFLSWIRRTRSA
jgi:hypothetical protein